MGKKYRVSLTVEEAEELKGLVSRGRSAAYRQRHARILLLSNENQSGGAMQDREIARVLQVGTATVERVRRRCVEEGVQRGSGPEGAGPSSSEEAGWPGRSPPDSLGLWRTTGRASQLDPATAS